MTIKQKIKDYLKSKRRWVSHQELEKQADRFGCCGSTIMRTCRRLYNEDPHIDRREQLVVYYKYVRL
jgi:hypothetical protein